MLLQKNLMSLHEEIPVVVKMAYTNIGNLYINYFLTRVPFFR